MSLSVSPYCNFSMRVRAGDSDLMPVSRPADHIAVRCEFFTVSHLSACAHDHTLTILNWRDDCLIFLEGFIVQACK
jgi:hypothetical protein